MDHDLIYAKTASGEAAMLQRTRVMQRNVRMVLILVDSQSSVADLCLKTGNPALTENALIELEKGGYIEPRAGGGSIWVESTKVAQEAHAAASGQRSAEFSPLVTAQPAVQSVPWAALSVDGVVKTSSPSDDSETPLMLAQPGLGAISVGVEAETGGAARVQSSNSNAAAASFVERIQAYFTRERFCIGKARSVFADSRGEFPLNQERREAPSEDQLLENRRFPVPGIISQTGEALVRQPNRRALARSMGWPTVIVLAIAGTLFVLLVAVFPFDNYLSELEAAISNASGRPVKVGSLHLNVYPHPSVVLGDVRIGVDKEEIRIDEIRLQPAIGTLMAEKTVFRQVTVSGVSLPVEVIAGLPAVLAALSNPSARFGAEHIGLEKVAITFSALGFSNLDGEARLSADGLLKSLSLSSVDHRLRLVVVPQTPGLDVVLEGGEGWRPVPGSVFFFDSANLNAFIDDGVLTIKDMVLRIFDGVVEGRAVLRANQTLNISGELSFKRISAARLGEAIGFGQQFSGETSGKIRFSTKGDTWESIFSAINAEGDFVMRRGSIGGIDLAEAARNAFRTPIQGGGTPFENLSGTVKLTPAGCQFSGLVLTSGLMQSTGALHVSNELIASGIMELKIRGTANQTRVPISISGPLKLPTVEAGRSGTP
jgi:hypothetical protein